MDKTELSDWLDNLTPDKLGDLGYWVGYRMVKSYYQHAPDKPREIGEIIRYSKHQAHQGREEENRVRLA